MAPKITFTVEDLRTAEGTELVLQQFRTAIDKLLNQKPEKQSLVKGLTPEEIAELAKLMRDQLQAPGAAPLSIQDLPGTPASSSTLIGGLSVTYFVGTLSPDTRPFLTIFNAYQAIFWSLDFNHLYFWDGILWNAIERTCGSVFWFDGSGPAGVGWHICDGSVVNRTDRLGNVFSTTLPDLVTGNPYIRGGSTYSGPTATAAIAPTVSGTITATGSITGDIPDHKHIVSGDESGGAGKVAVSFAREGTGTGSAWSGPSGTIAANLPTHTHSFIAGTITGGPQDIGAFPWGDTGDFQVGGTGALSGTTDINNQDHYHDDGTLLCSLVYSTNNPAGTTGASSVLDPISTSIVGNTGLESGPHDHNFGSLAVDPATLTVETVNPHYHAVDVDTGGIVGAPIAITATFTDTSPDHFHNLEGETGVLTVPVANGLTFTGTPVSGSSLTVSATGEPLHMTLLPYYRL